LRGSAILILCCVTVLAEPRVALLIPDLRCGGLERLSLDLASCWLQAGVQVDLLLCQVQGELLTSIPSGARVIGLRATRLRQLVSPLHRYLTEEPPDLLWAHLWPLTSIAVIPWLLAGRPCPLWLAEHTTLTWSARYELQLPTWLVSLVLRLTYPWATGLTAVSSGVAEDLVGLGAPSSRLSVVPNPAAVGRSAQRLFALESRSLWSMQPTHKILSVGNLKEQKNHALLLEALSLVSCDLPVELVILGDGPCRAALEQRIHHLGLQGQVSMPGFVSDPSPWYRSADLFVLSSSWEGFGNVLVEAMECGLPVVSTDCPSGPAEILGDGRFGTLVEPGNPLALAKAIQQALTAPVDREALVRRSQDFACSTIAERYLKLFGISHHA